MHALVTGASGGIGMAICSALALRGVTLTLHCHRDAAAAQALRRELAGEGHRVVAADLSEPDGVRHLWRETSALRPVDVLVNNAGIFPNHPPLTTDEDAWHLAWQRTLALNLTAAAHLSYYAARAMAAAGGGRLVSISSRGAFRGEPAAPAYAASKAGLNAFSQSLAKALAGSAVYVFVVAPGWVATPRVAQAIADPTLLAEQPLGRVASPQEIAALVSFCALDAPPSLTGAILDVNGASYLRS